MTVFTFSIHQNHSTRAPGSVKLCWTDSTAFDDGDSEVADFAGMLDGFAEGTVGYAALLQHIDDVLNADAERKTPLLEAVSAAESRGLNGFDASRLNAYIESRAASLADEAEGQASGEAADESDMPTEFIGADALGAQTGNDPDTPPQPETTDADDTGLSLEPLDEAPPTAAPGGGSETAGESRDDEAAPAADETAVDSDLTDVEPEDPTVFSGPDSEVVTRTQGGIDTTLPPREIRPGTVLKERFELVTPIGEGGMGMVYKARDLLKVEAQDRNPYIAVKLLAGDFRKHPEAFIALQRECSKTQRLAHPNIATVYDFDRDGGTVFMTMELLEGQELSRYIKRLPAGGMDAEEGLALIEQICKALGYAHARGLVHSDLKPGNVFITRDGTIKLLDFGISRASKLRADVEGEDTLFDPVSLGALTPAYATPQMFEGAVPDPRDDIYALACIAYELLSGRHPFNKLSAMKVKEKGLSPEPIRKLTKRQNQALVRALALERNDRTPNVDTFWDELQPRKSRMPVVLGAAAVLLVTLAILGYTLGLPALRSMRTEALIEQLQKNGTSDVPAVLDQLDKMSDATRRNVLDGAKDIIIGYYQSRIQSDVNPDQGHYDYPAALQTIGRLKKMYPDSAQVIEMEGELRKERDNLLAEQWTRFAAFLDSGSILPDPNGEDITDVVAILREAAPDSPLLHDDRLIKQYRAKAAAALDSGQYELADRTLDAGLAYAPDDADLLRLRDHVLQSEAADAAQNTYRTLADKLTQQAIDTASPGDVLGAADNLSAMASLYPEPEAADKWLKPARETFHQALEQHIGNQAWPEAESLIEKAGTILTPGDLAKTRDALSGAEIDRGWQPPSLSEHVASVEKARQAVQALLDKPDYTPAWLSQLHRAYTRLLTLVRPGAAWFDELHGKLATALASEGKTMLDAGRRLRARQMLDAGERIVPGAPALKPLADALAQDADNQAGGTGTQR